MVIVDGYNVVGSVPDGWWRDRPAAVRRLLGRLICLRRQADDEVVLVLDVVQPGLPEGDHGGVEVRYPQRPGRNAADGKILELLAELQAGSARRPDIEGTGGPSRTGSGRDASDEGDGPASERGGPDRGSEPAGDGVEVVTSDRALAASAAEAGATVTGARTFLARLDDLGC